MSIIAGSYFKFKSVFGGTHVTTASQWNEIKLCNSDEQNSDQFKDYEIVGYEETTSLVSLADN